VKAAVLGAPIAHSLSPVLHRAAYQALGLTGWSYEAIDCDETRLPAVLGGCGPDWAGLSLTMPLKRAVLPLLDEIEPLARQVGAANTVVFSGGRRYGHNTDVPGMIAALAEAGVTGALGGATVLILGGGATACSALAAARSLGAARVTVAVRDPARARDLLAAAARLAVAVTLTGFDAPEVLIPQDDAPEVLISTVPAGAADIRDDAPEVLISTVPAGAADIYAERIAHRTLVPRHLLDVVYHPWPTPLAAAARKADIPLAGGLDLLLHQAAGQVTLMTGQPAPLPAMRQALESALIR
jgi:shikimate dehydrogenase